MLFWLNSLNGFCSLWLNPDWYIFRFKNVTGVFGNFIFLFHHCNYMDTKREVRLASFVAFDEQVNWKVITIPNWCVVRFLGTHVIIQYACAGELPIAPPDHSPPFSPHPMPWDWQVAMGLPCPLALWMRRSGLCWSSVPPCPSSPLGKHSLYISKVSLLI